MKVCAIDPGLAGAVVIFDGKKFKSWPMPVTSNGKNNEVEFDGVHELLWDISGYHPGIHVYLERAMPMAMGAKHAFNYGRGFAALEIALRLLRMPTTYVEPGKWAKVMHEGISADLKPKAKSLIAVKRLFPKLVESLPKNRNGKLLDGPIDALLIASYGIRCMSRNDT
jgi:hypothetical protein